MTPLPRIRNRHTEEQPTDQSEAVEEPPATPIPAEPETSVPPPSVDRSAMIAEAAATVQASAAGTSEDGAAEAGQPPGAEGGSPTRESLRRFGRWATGRQVPPQAEGADAEQAAISPADAAEAAVVAQPDAAEAEPLAEPQAPAGAPATPPRGSSAKDRGRLRRRIRYLRRARELGFRDLGGLMFDQYRFRSTNQELLAAKLAALHALDSERRALEHILGERREFDDLREPGIASCPSCGALHASDANFCERCGAPQSAAPIADSEPVADDAPPPP
jgi:hypothetical protein